MLTHADFVGRQRALGKHRVKKVSHLWTYITMLFSAGSEGFMSLLLMLCFLRIVMEKFGSVRFRAHFS